MQKAPFLWYSHEKAGFEDYFVEVCAWLACIRLVLLV